MEEYFATHFSHISSLLVRNSGEAQFWKNLLNYIRLKEKNDLSKLKHAERKQKREFISDEMDDSEQSEIKFFTSDLKHQSSMVKNNQMNWEAYEDVWSRIEDHLSEQKTYVRIDNYIIKYTNILKSHIEHRVRLDRLCAEALVSSVRPSYIEDIFDLNLIDEDTDVGSLLKDKIFTCLKKYFYINSSPEPFYLIMTISVLLYKTNCKQYSEEIKHSLKKLANFIHAKKYDAKFKKNGISQFIDALILNGVIDRTCLNSFLTLTTSPHTYLERTSDHDDGDNDDEDEYWRESSISSDDSDELEAHFHYIFPHIQIILNHANNLPNVNDENDSAQIDLIATAEINSKFPLSLKSLARIEVKNSMIDFSKRNVEKLNFLPRDLQDFLVFRDEINEIKRIVADN